MPDGLFPILSAPDPNLEAEGSIDPLGLYSIADQVGSRLAPGVRERQTTVRFLTATAVSHALTDDFPGDTLGKDGVSEPWQVFEWYAVEGFVRTLEDEEELRGIPGRAKAKRVVDEGLSLNRAQYLKTPTVFGFHGVYRALATALDIETGGQLGPNGARLVRAWEQDQGLDGFALNGRGAGKPWYDMLRRAVVEGLDAGQTVRSGNWQGWQFFRQHLAPRHPGPREKQVLDELLRGASIGHRRALLDAMTSAEGQRVAAQAFEQRGRFWDRALHTLLLERYPQDEPLLALVRAAQAYEALARLLTDAFDDARYAMTQRRGKTTLRELGELGTAQQAAASARTLYAQAHECLAALELGHTLANNLGWLREPLSAEAFMRQLLEHHVTVQRRKLPRGKAPWVECFDDGTYMVRTLYRLDDGPDASSGYVNAYRAGPLWRFATDLGWVYGAESEAVEEG